HHGFHHLQGQIALVRAELDLEGRHAVGAHDHVLGHFHRNDVPRLHVENVAQLQLTPHHRGTQRHVDVEDVLAQRLDPALVLVADVGLETGIEHLANRLDHRVGHGDMEIAAATVQLDVEGRDHHHLAGADDIGQRRVDLRMHVLEVDFQDRLPGFLEIVERLVEHHAHHAQLGGCEFAALDLGMAAVAAEEVVHQLEHQLGVENEQRSAAQRLDLHQVQAGGHVQRVDVFAELHHLHAADRDVRRAPQQVEHADAGIAGETLVDHLQRGHAPAHDPVLTGQVVALDAARLGI